MSTTTKRPNRCAFATEALMVRALHSYRFARGEAENDGADVSADYAPPTYEALTDRYDKLLDEWASETPDTISDTMTYLDLVSAIIDGELISRRGDDAGPVSSERDFAYAQELLNSVRRRLNELDTDELIKDERAKLTGSRLGTAVVKTAGQDAEVFQLVASYRAIEREVNFSRKTSNRSESEINQLCDAMRANRDRLDKVRPVTLRGVLAVLDLGSVINDPEWWPDEAIAGLREIAAREGGQ